MNPPSDSWTRARVAAAAAFFLFLSVQLLLPVTMLAVRGGLVGSDEVPRTGELPLSWQMYTVVLAPRDLTVTDGMGRVHELDPVGTFGVLGSRMTYDADALARACGAVSNARDVSIVIASVQVKAEC